MRALALLLAALTVGWAPGARDAAAQRAVPSPGALLPTLADLPPGSSRTAREDRPKVAVALYAVRGGTLAVFVDDAGTDRTAGAWATIAREGARQLLDTLAGLGGLRSAGADAEREDVTLGAASVALQRDYESPDGPLRALVVAFGRGRYGYTAGLLVHPDSAHWDELIALARGADARLRGIAGPRAVQPMPPMPDSLPPATAGGDRDAFEPATVDELPQLIQAPTISYPSAARDAGLQGWVVLEFVIGTDGRPERRSITAVAWSDTVFVAPAVDAIRRARFRPGRIAREPVRVLVRQPLHFQLQRD